MPICGGTAAHRRHIMRCPGRCAGARRRVVSSWPSSPYYGPHFTCCHCGDQWGDGELMERPFRPGWRDENTARAKRLWATSKTGWPGRDEHLRIIPDAA